MKPPTVGLLPLSLKLYDTVVPRWRSDGETFYRQIAAALTQSGLRVLTTDICRVAAEFRAAVAFFEGAGAEALVTLHLAYSPSLESDRVLARTRLPLIVLDTTPARDFRPGSTVDDLLRNHGIHGVQDLCNRLVRHGKHFQIEAGHWQTAAVLARVARWARAAQAATAFRRSRVGRIGPPFPGMGDFVYPPDELPIETVPATPRDIAALLPDVTDAEIKAEITADRRRFICKDLDADVHRRSVRDGLALRHWMKRERVTAFSVNFAAVERSQGLRTVPFLEASKALARGVGYAGEGDVLTAALVGALAAAYPATTFAEMFCPGWRRNTIFLSHMGEINVDLIDGKPILAEKPYNFSDADNPAVAWGCLRPGAVALVSLAPLGGGRYRLIVSPGRMQRAARNRWMPVMVQGWFRPRQPVAEFLAAYSRAGGPHHAALVYDADHDGLAAFGRFLDWDVATI